MKDRPRRSVQVNSRISEEEREALRSLSERTGSARATSSARGCSVATQSAEPTVELEPEQLMHYLYRLARWEHSVMATMAERCSA